MVYGIVKQHNGLINVYSQKGHGTTFKIYLPAFSGQAEAITTPKLAELRGGNETILLAEDNDMLRELAETILKNSATQYLQQKTVMRPFRHSMSIAIKSHWRYLI